MAEDTPHGLPRAAHNAAPASVGGKSLTAMLSASPIQSAARPVRLSGYIASETWVEDSYDYAYFQGGGRDSYREYWADEGPHFANAGERGEQVRRFGAAAPGVRLDGGCTAECRLVDARNTGSDVCGVDISPWATTEAIDAVLTRIGFDRPAILAIAKGAERQMAPRLAGRQAVRGSCTNAIQDRGQPTGARLHKLPTWDLVAVIGVTREPERGPRQP